MKRLGIIEIVGKDFLTENIEGGEFSYIQALGKKVTGHFKVDLRFYSEEAQVAVLVETKTIYKAKDAKQLFRYVELEQELDNRTKIIAILANTENNMFKIWKIENDECSELDDRKIKSMEEYIAYFKKQNSNDKTTVLENTSKLNRILHDNGIPEKLRSQFVGTCLLALKNGLVYKDLETDQIISGIKQNVLNIIHMN